MKAFKKVFRGLPDRGRTLDTICVRFCSSQRRRHCAEMVEFGQNKEGFDVCNNIRGNVEPPLENHQA
jgi:hypothetical protein